jgi:predicted Rdx family selenoprotein
MLIYKIAEDVLSKTVNDEEVIVNLKTGTYFGLNPTGTVIWNHLKKGSAPEVILNDLLEQFETSEDELKQDIEHFVSHLKSQNMLSEV